jgi:hypothetical protein
MCYEVQVVSFDNFDLGPSPVLDSTLPGQSILLSALFASHVSSGHLGLTFIGNNFGDPADVHLRPSEGGQVFYGLPAVGFLAVNYINSNVTPGVLSNYSGVYPHRSTVSCKNSTNPQGTCQ